MVISLKPYSAFMYDLVGSAGVEPASLLRCTSAVFQPSTLTTRCVIALNSLAVFVVAGAGQR